MNDMSTASTSARASRSPHPIAAGSVNEDRSRLRRDSHNGSQVEEFTNPTAIKTTSPKNLRRGQQSTARTQYEADRRVTAFLSTALVEPGSGFAVREELLWEVVSEQTESLNRLYNIVGQAELDVVLYDEKGYFVGQYGARAKYDDRSAPLTATSLTSASGPIESDNAITPAGDKAAETLKRGPTEPAHRSPTCLAAPVFGGDASLIGFLDVAPRNPDVSREASSLAVALARSAARAIEERAFRKRHHRQWIIALLSRDNIGHGFLLALDEQQRIVAMDRHTQATLTAGGMPLKQGVSLWTIFERNTALFRNPEMRDIPASLVSTETSQTWSALITPPESAAIIRGNPAQAILHTRPRLDSIGHLCRSGPPAPSIGGLTPRALQRVREYVELHLAGKIELEELANLVGLSRCYFARAFRQSVGMPPHCYIIKRRLERAQDLLAQTDLSLAQIALESGFTDQSHFSRRFRLLLGVTPRSFRRARR